MHKCTIIFTSAKFFNYFLSQIFFHKTVHTNIPFKMNLKSIDTQLVKLRIYQQAKKIKTEDLASKLGISTSLLYKLYSGHRDITQEVSDKINTFITNDTDIEKNIIEESVVNYRKISKITHHASNVELLDSLSVNTEIFTNSHGNKFTSIDNDFYIEVPVLLHEAYARYVDNMTNAKPYESERFVTFPIEKIDNNYHLAFKVHGDSMAGGNINDTPERAIILGRGIDKSEWFNGGLKKSEYGFVILTAYNILFKDIIKVDADNGEITCHSRNKSPEYSDFVLKVDEIYSIFKVIKRTF